MVSGRRGDGEQIGLDWTADYVGDPWRWRKGWMWVDEAGGDAHSLQSALRRGQWQRGRGRVKTVTISR